MQLLSSMYDPQLPRVCLLVDDCFKGVLKKTISLYCHPACCSTEESTRVITTAELAADILLLCLLLCPDPAGDVEHQDVGSWSQGQPRVCLYQLQHPSGGCSGGECKKPHEAHLRICLIISMQLSKTSAPHWLILCALLPFHDHN